MLEITEIEHEQIEKCQRWKLYDERKENTLNSGKKDTESVIEIN